MKLQEALSRSKYVRRAAWGADVGYINKADVVEDQDAVASDWVLDRRAAEAPVEQAEERALWTDEVDNSSDDSEDEEDSSSEGVLLEQ
jgi:hypothetical protein